MKVKGCDGLIAWISITIAFLLITILVVVFVAGRINAHDDSGRIDPPLDDENKR
jgi:hypothetical protein